MPCLIRMSNGPSIEQHAYQWYVMHAPFQGIRVRAMAIFLFFGNRHMGHLLNVQIPVSISTWFLHVCNFQMRICRMRAPSSFPSLTKAKEQPMGATNLPSAVH